jgi:hypothetical protein
MSLFLLLSFPLMFIFVTLLPWDVEAAPRPFFLVSTFLKGMLCFFPAYIALIIVRGIIGVSFTGFLLYLSLLLREHLTPILLAVGAFLLLQRKLSFPHTREGIFLTIFSFLMGFFSLLAIADFIALFGRLGASTLFLEPLRRLGAVFVLSILAIRYHRWEGRDGAIFISACAGIALALAFIDWVYFVSFRGIAAILSSLVFCGSAFLFIRQFPRTLIASQKRERL